MEIEFSRHCCEAQAGIRCAKMLKTGAAIFVGAFLAKTLAMPRGRLLFLLFFLGPD